MTRDSSSSSPLALDDHGAHGSGLSIAEVVAVARGDRPVEFGAGARRRMESARGVVERLLATGEPIYGVNTGFGSLARKRINADGVREVQRNLLRSHAAGVGEPLPRELVRAMLLLLAASLCRGCSGARPVVVERIVELLNRKVTPIVPSRGSVGASGDLAPLAHAALVLIGEGEANYKGRVLPGAEALSAAGLAPIELEAKEGLALINGTHLMAALAVLALHDFDRIIDASIVTTALSIDACKATDAFLDDRIHAVRGQCGQRAIAARIRECLQGSEIIPSHRDHDPRVQDPYSLRCAPQILGAVIDTAAHARTIIERELSGVTDNPLVFAAGTGAETGAGVGANETNLEPDSARGDAIISGGNFHGLPLGLIMDSLSIAVAHLAGVSERRVYYLLAASDSENPINVYLSPQPGLHSGLMIAQYTAAALCNEIQSLATPASVANIPTSAGQEDYNSFGPLAGYQLRRAVDLATNVIAIEALCSAEALEYHRPLRSGAAVERAHAVIRGVVPRLTQDRPPSPDIERITDLIRRGELAP